VPASELDRLRKEHHDDLCREIIAQRRTRDGSPKYKNGLPVYNFADGDDIASVALAAGVVEILDRPLSTSPPGPQTAGTLFTRHTRSFLEQALSLLAHLLPGEWFLETRPSLAVIAKFDQYEHLEELDRIAGENAEIAAVLGSDYVVTPDIVIGRHPFGDAEINAACVVVGDDSSATHSPTRAANGLRPTLKASVSCKWTMRSDRAQNTRTEANNLIRNRKGQAPHIVAVTMEPLPSRLESIAMGLGEIDCAYHGCLHELLESASAVGATERGRLDALVRSRRLRDISDLPLDLVG
jgi:hypothetical protein